MPNSQGTRSPSTEERVGGKTGERAEHGTNPANNTVPVFLDPQSAPRGPGPPQSWSAQCSTDCTVPCQQSRTTSMLPQRLLLPPGIADGRLPQSAPSIAVPVLLGKELDAAAGKKSWKSTSCNAATMCRRGNARLLDFPKHCWAFLMDYHVPCGCLLKNSAFFSTEATAGHISGVRPCLYSACLSQPSDFGFSSYYFLFFPFLGSSIDQLSYIIMEDNSSVPDVSPQEDARPPVPPAVDQECSGCQQTKDLSEFSGHKTCDACRKQDRKYRERKRKGLKNGKFCSSCRKTKDPSEFSGHKTCDACRERGHERTLKGLGNGNFCNRCHKTKDPSEFSGYRTCDTCREKSREDRERKREGLEDDNFCTGCGKTKDSSEFSGHKTCDACRERDRERMQKKMENGSFCTGCKKMKDPSEFSGYKTCDPCRERDRERKRAEKATNWFCFGCHNRKPSSQFSDYEMCAACHEKDEKRWGEKASIGQQEQAVQAEQATPLPPSLPSLGHSPPPSLSSPDPFSFLPPPTLYFADAAPKAGTPIDTAAADPADNQSKSGRTSE
ncbi:hypothetical protein EJ06DRAFT_271366 [Trichodelitschia bisporula]|uniref:Uncharacterized protein n=1 Tax=Trichodelitschia bisporula TaxID=703511 RepID=A0A6G1I4U3_9PEZI|nr:hypothetical protein EJ06DRAFT_271366 [Trichodelitschia bisporula]